MSAIPALAPRASFASLTIQEVSSTESILIEASHEERLETGDLLPIYSRLSARAIGYLKVSKKGKKTQQGRQLYLGQLLPKEEEIPVRRGDYLKRVDFTSETTELHGRSDLLLEGGKSYSARYRPLTYQGVLIGETAATLDKGEALIDILTNLSYGVTDNLNISTVALGNIVAPNLSAKYRLINNDWLSFSASLGATFSSPAVSKEGFRFYSGNLTTYYDIKSNSKLVSHTAISISTSPGLRAIAGQDSLVPQFQSSIRTGYEYVFDNWDRLLFGPEYNFGQQAVGGYLGYMFIWDHFHLSIDLNVTNLTKFELGPNGYLPYAYMFWRI